MNPDKNDSDEKREYQAWLGSLVIHAVIFVIVCFTGLFMVVSPPPKEQTLDISIYDADAGGGNRSGSGGGTAPRPTPSAIDDVVLSK